MIRFIKIAPYSPLLPACSKYESLKRLTLHEHDPGIDRAKTKEYLKKTGLNLEAPDIVCCSHSKRAKETLAALYEFGIIKRGGKETELGELNEIRFDMEKICQEDEYDEHGSGIVRKRFLELFVEDSLADKRADIKKSFDSLKALLSRNKDREMLLVSHTFTIKLFGLYLQLGEELFENPKVLRELIDCDRRIMDYLEVTEIVIRSNGI